MIRNIVFDLGNVLVDFDPKFYMQSFGFSEQEIQNLFRLVYEDDWRLYDRGDYGSVTDLCDAVCKKHPAYASAFKKILCPEWVRIHTLKEETARYLSELKARGYRIYLLSNLSKESYDYVSSYPFFALIDGGVYSYQEHICKPDRGIYEVLLSRYALRADETVFLDDAEANVEAANRLGIHGVLFSTIEQVKLQLENLLQQA